MAEDDIIISQEDQQREEEMIQAEFKALLDDYSKTPHRQKVELIEKAFRFAKMAHKGVRRRSGEPYIMHPLAVARIVVREIGLGSTSICSALLHDVVEDTEYTTADIENLFGPKIASIVDGLTKISGGVFGTQASMQAENFRKLLLTMSEDVRVILIKIADRLHNMRTLEFQPREKQYKIAGETQYIYAPLAHRLGLFTIKTELENLSFKYEHPETYKELSDKLAQITGSQMAFFDEFSTPIRQRLKQMGYTFDLNARIKSVYSIYNKMQAKSIPFEDVYDLLAVRIIFDPLEGMSEKDQCWRIYSALTEIYKPHPERIRDWISTPKANGYEALHVTVMGQNGQWVEVQIRSRRMHEIAEKGLAAHWKYKEKLAAQGTVEETELDKWLKTIKDILQNPEPSAMDFLDTFKLNLFSSEIMVFTPNGEIRTMPKGSTALDFAFAIHSDLGIHSTGAKINHLLEPLSYELKGGDQIEIITDSEQHPQLEWLNIVTTAKAKSRLQAYFRKEDRAAMQKGEELFEQKLQELGMVELKEGAMQQMLKHYRIKQPQELMKQIGKGIIQLDNLKQLLTRKQRSLLQRLNPFSSKPKEEIIVNQPEQLPSGKNKIRDIILTEANYGKEYQIAECCRPIPGDEVLGYQEEDGNITIHRRNCPIATRLKAINGKRFCTAEWETHRQKTFVETIEIRGLDQVGIVIKVLKIISEDFKINIKDLHIDASDGVFLGNIQLYVYDTEEIKALNTAIRKINGIDSVQRIVHLDGIEDIAELD